MSKQIHIYALEVELESIPLPDKAIEIMKELISLYQETKTIPPKSTLQAVQTITRLAAKALATKMLSSKDENIIDKSKVRDLLLSRRSEEVDKLIALARKVGMKYELEGKVRTVDSRFGR